jgi:hypothetical protein
LQVCSARPLDGAWLLETHGSIAPGALRSVRPADLGLTPEQAASSLVFMSPKPLSGRCETLPRFEGFESAPAWRANLRILAGSTSVSYQGEYPAGMFDIRRPSLVAVCSMLQPGLTNALFLPSFSAHASLRKGTLRLTRVKTGALLAEVGVECNCVNFIDLHEVNLPDPPELLLLSSEDMAGIPLFFTRDAEGKRLSLEHTHPPAELTVFGTPDTRNRVIQSMRSAWIGISRHG